jgi:hypothetical protein
MAEIVLATGIHREIGRHRFAVLVEKAHHAAEMIPMAVDGRGS